MFGSQTSKPGLRQPRKFVPSNVNVLLPGAFMNWLWSKSRTARAVEVGLNMLEAAIGFGLIGGAAVVSAMGNFLLGGLFAAFACGVFARLNRRTRAKTPPSPTTAGHTRS